MAIKIYQNYIRSQLYFADVGCGNFILRPTLGACRVPGRRKRSTRWLARGQCLGDVTFSMSEKLGENYSKLVSIFSCCLIRKESIPPEELCAEPSAAGNKERIQKSERLDGWGPERLLATDTLDIRRPSRSDPWPLDPSVSTKLFSVKTWKALQCGWGFCNRS